MHNSRSLKEAFDVLLRSRLSIRLLLSVTFSIKAAPSGEATFENSDSTENDGCVNTWRDKFGIIRKFNNAIGASSVV